MLGVGFVAGKGFFVDGGNGNAEMGNIFMTLDLRPYLYPFQWYQMILSPNSSWAPFLYNPFKQELRHAVYHQAPEKRSAQF